VTPIPPSQSLLGAGQHHNSKQVPQQPAGATTGSRCRQAAAISHGLPQQPGQRRSQDLGDHLFQAGPRCSSSTQSNRFWLCWPAAQVVTWPTCAASGGHVGPGAGVTRVLDGLAGGDLCPQGAAWGGSTRRPLALSSLSSFRPRSRPECSSMSAGQQAGVPSDVQSPCCRCRAMRQQQMRLVLHDPVAVNWQSEVEAAVPRVQWQFAAYGCG